MTRDFEGYFGAKNRYDWITLPPVKIERIEDSLTVESTKEKIIKITDEIKEMLLAKNEKYGDSAITPSRIFSQADAKEQIKVRIDDKLSRVKTAHLDEDEDVVNDLIGYLILLKVAMDE